MGPAGVIGATPGSSCVPLRVHDICSTATCVIVSLPVYVFPTCCVIYTCLECALVRWCWHHTPLLLGRLTFSAYTNDQRHNLYEDLALREAL